MFAWDLSFIQLFCLPLVALLLWRIKLLGTRLPAWIPLGSCALAFIFFVASQPFVSLAIGSHRVFLSELQKDEDGTLAYKLRSRLDTILRQEGALRTRRLRAEFGSSKEVTKWLSTRPGAVVLSGNHRWLTVSFAARDPLKLSETAFVAKHQKLPSLELVQALPAIGLSFEPRNETAHFLGFVLAADELGDAVPGSVLFAQAETKLRDAAEMAAPWTASFHRALPWWMLGNLYLKELLVQESYQPALMQCALEAYEMARKFLSPKDVISADLYAAVRNNHAVALVIQSTQEEQPSQLFLAHEYFREARNMRKTPNVHAVKARPAKVASANLERLGANKRKGR
jgi:hypothetical protein